MRNIFIIKFLFLISTLVFGKALFVFFAQDDFILISQFSQSNLFVDFTNTIGKADVTHWRPLHNLFFFINGNLFGKFYFGYHLATIILHVLTSFLVYKILEKVFRNTQTAFISSIVYAIHPAHFTSLVWISGGAITIGFFLLSLCIYFLLANKKAYSILFFILSLLASESMVVGIFIIYAICIYMKIKDYKSFLLKLFVLCLLFLTGRTFLSSNGTADAYQLALSFSNLSAVKYYALRILGFPESDLFNFTSVMLIAVYAFFGYFLISTKNVLRERRALFVLTPILILGLFPFVFIPNHLSAHYMTVSVFAFSGLVGYFAQKAKPSFAIAFVFLFFIASIFSFWKNLENSWVVERSKIAKDVLLNIEEKKLVDNSTVIFDNNQKVSSEEVYVSLGTGKAIDFWFSCAGGRKECRWKRRRSYRR